MDLPANAATPADVAESGAAAGGDGRSSVARIAGTKGGAGVWQRIISEMPAHEVYIEPFWGRGTIARAKRPARVTIGIDRDPDAISDGKDLATMFLADGLQWVKDYFHLRSSPAGGYRVGRPSPQSAASAEATFGGAPCRRHFVYFDPPYLGCSGYYKHELSDEQHRDLCRVLLGLPCPAALSGYASRIYAEELSGAREIAIPTVNRAGKRVIERLWMNFTPPRRYHDVRYIGVDRRERERIRRRVKTWSEGLAAMPPAERQAVWEACDAVYRDPAASHNQTPIMRSQMTGG